MKKEPFWQNKMQYSEFQKALSEIEVCTVQLENTNLVTVLKKEDTS
jgi:hypothetical protein